MDQSLTPDKNVSTLVPPHPFKGRTVAVVNDFALQEQWYLYQKTRELKEAISKGEDLSRFRIQNREAAVYTIFMEDSTRTKESFRNAAEFHGLKVNMFDAKTSSFQKNETITDTVKMLLGYSIGQSTFVIRSKIEGVCRWLEEALGPYAQQRGLPRPSFINAGDGRHEHPTQEMLDEFSFLEHKGWDTDSIHVALLGDLFHGRTVHSKVDGLKLYSCVDVDLIAPPELALPKTYEDRMVAAGFNVRKFASISDYLDQAKVASIWYFTRLQLERMGDKVREKSMDLRQAVTMQKDFLPRLPATCKFFHPLPRDARYPTLPFWLDNTELNGWDQQSQNGYFTRIVLLGMLAGHFGQDFIEKMPANLKHNSPSAMPSNSVNTSSSSSPIIKQKVCSEELQPLSLDSVGGTPERQKMRRNTSDRVVMSMASDFITEVPLEHRERDARSAVVGLAPIKEGIIIDHLAEGQDVEQIWGLMYMLRSVLSLTSVGGQGVYQAKDGPGQMCGFISVPNFDIGSWERLPLKRFAATAPGSTLNLVEDGLICRKFQLQVPPRIYGFSDISCKNTACMSHVSQMQHEVSAFFVRVKPQPAEMRDNTAWRFTCKYCETVHDFWQIWDYRSI